MGSYLQLCDLLGGVGEAVRQKFGLSKCARQDDAGRGKRFLYSGRHIGVASLLVVRQSLAQLSHLVAQPNRRRQHKERK